MTAALVVLCAASVASSGEAPATLQTLHEWDFEDGVQGWKKWSSALMRQSARRGDAASGNRALWGKIIDQGALVHLVDGLDFPTAGTRLRFWYFVPEDSSFSHFDVNLRTHQHGPQPNPTFQTSMGIRKGKWTLVDMPFTRFFGWSERDFASLTVRSFEVAAVGTGELLLDDVQVLLNESVRRPRSPSVLWLEGEDAARAAPGARVWFRRAFTLKTTPRFAWAQAGGDDEGRVWVNGVDLGSSSLQSPVEHDLAGILQEGKNVVAIEVRNHGSAPNPSGAVAVVGWGDHAPDEELLVTNDLWAASTDPGEGWQEVGGGGGGWAAAGLVCRVPAPPRGILDIYPARRPLDRTAPEVSVEIEDGGLWSVYKWRRTSDWPVGLSVSLHRLDPDMTTQQVIWTSRAVMSTKKGGTERFRDFDLPERGGPHEMQFGISATESSPRRRIWLPEEETAQLDLTTTHQLTPTDSFRAEKIGDRWWLVDPQGNLFWSLSVNAVMQQAYWSHHYHRHVRDTYQTIEDWSEITCWRLLEWGFNSSTGGDGGLEPYRRRGVPYFVGWNLTWAGPWLQKADGQRVMFPDIFDPQWLKGAEERVKETTDRYRDDPLVIGYFTDNEIMMHSPLSRSQGVMDAFWSPGCQEELIRWVAERYGGDIAELNRAWSSPHHEYAYESFEDLAQDKPSIRGEDDPVGPDLRDFVRHIIRRYAEVYVGLWKKHDPNHLVCSNRFAGQFDLDFAELLEPYDIIACNSYPRSYWGQTEFDAGQLEWLRGMHERTGKPVLITEWGVTATDSELPNFWGRLDTQQQRGDAYGNVLEQLWEEGHIVGSHWFSWGDATDGERRNWGMVDAYDRPYLPVTGAMTRANGRMWERVRDWRP